MIMRTKQLLIIGIILLLLSACGSKGPVRPVDTTLSDTGQIKTDKQPEKRCDCID